MKDRNYREALSDRVDTVDSHMWDCFFSQQCMFDAPGNFKIGGVRSSDYMDAWRYHQSEVGSEQEFKETERNNTGTEFASIVQKRLTIKEAAVCVLEAKGCAMTAEEIYNVIVEHGLYRFNAQNPVNVIRTTIEYACDNSSYSNRNVIPYFHIKHDSEGRKVYSLLAMSATNTANNKVSASNNIIDLEYGKTGIRQILETHFRTLSGYSNIHILWDAAQNELSMFLNDNAINTANALWQIIGRIFGHEFVLSKPHIWQTAPTYPQNVRGLVINLARQHNGVVTREQIDDYFANIKIASPINATLLSQNELLFCDKATLMPTDNQDLNPERCDAIAQALSKLFIMENTPYIVLRDIRTEWFLCLPELQSGVNWTPLLLQEVLRVCPNIGFRTILPNLKGQDFDTIGAALVPNNSDIATFADVVHRYCYEKYKLPHRISAENLRLELRNARMIEGNELIYNMYKALKDHRFAFDSEKQNVTILER